MNVLDKLKGVLANHFDAERRWADFPDIEALLKCLGLRALVLIPRDSNKSHWMQCRGRARVDIVGSEQSIPDVFSPTGMEQHTSIMTLGSPWRWSEPQRTDVRQRLSDVATLAPMRAGDLDLVRSLVLTGLGAGRAVPSEWRGDPSAGEVDAMLDDEGEIDVALQADMGSGATSPGNSELLHQARRCLRNDCAVVKRP